LFFLLTKTYMGVGISDKYTRNGVPGNRSPLVA